MKILLTGGGTLGSVTPLLALVEELRERMKKDDVGALDILWIGTRGGIERALISEYAIPFLGIYAGKLRPYFDVRNFIDPFFLCVGIVQSLIAIVRFGPDSIIGAGGYVSVPVMWAGWLLRKRIILMQLDLLPSLSNLLTVFAASAVLISCEEERRYFPAHKTHLVGIPVRKSLGVAKDRARDPREQKTMRESFGMYDDLPVLLVMGGGTGSVFINTLIEDCFTELIKICHIIHVTGKGKEHILPSSADRYHRFEFLTKDLIVAMTLADVVVTRAGMGSLAELAFLQKAFIVIPIPHSQQERNALYVEKKHAGIYCSQEKLTPQIFVEKVKKLMLDERLRKDFATTLEGILPSDAAQKAVDLLLTL